MRWLWIVFFTSAAASAVPAVNAGEEWIFINDGRVGMGDPAEDTITVTLSDQSKASIAKAAMLFHRTRDQVDRRVAAILIDLTQGKDVDQHAKELHVLGAAAMPKLLESLGGADPAIKYSAMFGVRNCWTPAAQESVFRAFDEGEPRMRILALEVLTHNVQEELVATHMKAYADGDDADTAALVLDVVDRFFPDPSLKRIQRVLRDPKHQKDAIALLSHYLTPKLTPDTLPLLDSSDKKVRRAGIVGLISQLAGGDAVRASLRGLLTDADAGIRETAAEYFNWLGRDDDLPALQATLQGEQDVYVKAALAAALDFIRARQKTSADDQAGKLIALQSGDVLEPGFMYQWREHDRKDAFVRRSIRLQEFLAAPCVGAADTSFLGAAEFPAATVWLPPVRDYFDPARRSFGVCVGNRQSAFANSVHIGDDVNWGNELRTVVAAAPGVVRLVAHIFSWGHIVIVEHQDAAGDKYCTLYAHLSPALSVKPGDIVAAGQRIGSTGRSNTVENGGYFSHLHFGVHRGAYATPGKAWVSGYVSKEKWDSGEHEWMNPQEFLKAHGPGAKP